MTTTTTDQKFEAWGLVELFGHQRVAGRISEQAVGGCNFVRVDIPKENGSYYTRLFGQGAIYGITITSKEVALQLAERYATKPAFAWEIEQPKLEAPSSFEPDDDGSCEDEDYPLC